MIRLIEFVIIFLLILVILLFISYIYRDIFKKYYKREIYLHSALRNNEFDIYIQPKYSLKSESIVGAECLVRVNSKNKRVINTERFIYILEKDKSIIELDLYILEEACKIINRWSDNKFKLVPISVNVSRVTLIEDDTFITKLNDIINNYNIDTRFLEIEVTERVMLKDTNKIISVIKEIKDLGIKVSLDDFGSGYSSLTILKNLPIDTIKLDKLFLDKKDISEKGKIVIESIINMANRLGLEVVAEGVEYFEQAQVLKNLGCEIVQGYLYGRPTNISDFEKLEIFN
ncbi:MULTISPECIES: EAL domain-containing protein [Clostridium]|uniref:EAL domain-containing protein n=1 Tax=Clostridium TaxID=1485 RepID=UPI001FAA5C9A|nr:MULTISPECIES: EAL domain-containing protein [Clostridium]MDB1934477.1 EAL domain-containing protein [Clostridium tertium]MDB1937659.1 EAL domain-containing protein [Clostridium tertium]MDB1941359.1 EAL domain-containing protein [Clostridium tertium]MDB1944408.1 EAL domain-containing protein [Clostridium tertium]MDB1947856.1 EAL domain-containing protein [Clostridium tertium]